MRTSRTACSSSTWRRASCWLLEDANRLARLAVDLFEDPKNGGFYFTPVDGEGLVARKKDLDDHPTPSGNSMLAFVLLRLARIYGDEDLQRKAVGVFRLGYGLIDRAPGAVGHMLCALDLYFAPPREMAIVGPWSAPATRDLRTVALQRYAPNTVVAFAEGGDDPSLERIPLLAGKGLVDGVPAAYVCENFACQAPVTSAESLVAALDG